MYNAKSIVYFKALYRLINMQLNVAKSKARRRAPQADAILPISDHGAHAAELDLGVDFTEGGKPENPEKNPRSTGEIKNSTHISSKFDNQHEAIPRWSPIQL